MKDIVQKAGLASDFYIASAATSSEELGNPVHRGTRAKLAEVGISCAGKTARKLTKADYEDYDYLIGMDSWNMKNINRLFGKDRDHKIHKLLDFTQRSGDIADPWYSGDFEATYRDVLEGCQGLFAAIMENC